METIFSISLNEDKTPHREIACFKKLKPTKSTYVVEYYVLSNSNEECIKKLKELNCDTSDEIARYCLDLLIQEGSLFRQQHHYAYSDLAEQCGICPVLNERFLNY